MTPIHHEYRVCWQREGMARRTAIYQTKRGAEEKVAALEWAEQMRDDPPSSMDAADDYFHRTFGLMPKLVTAPTIETRTVGAWA